MILATQLHLIFSMRNIKANDKTLLWTNEIMHLSNKKGNTDQAVKVILWFTGLCWLVTTLRFIYFLIFDLIVGDRPGRFIGLFVHLLDYFHMSCIGSNPIETKSWTNWKEGIYTRCKIQIDVAFFVSRLKTNRIKI